MINNKIENHTDDTLDEVYKLLRGHVIILLEVNARHKQHTSGSDKLKDSIDDIREIYHLIKKKRAKQMNLSWWGKMLRQAKRNITDYSPAYDIDRGLN